MVVRARALGTAGSPASSKRRILLPCQYFENKNICASLGLRMKFKTLFMKEKHSHHSALPLFFNSYVQSILGPWGLCAECVQVSEPASWRPKVYTILCNPWASRELSLRAPRPDKLQMCLACRKRVNKASKPKI